MSKSLLSDFVNDRIRAVPNTAVCDGRLDVQMPSNRHAYESESDSEESDTEQKEYVRREIESYRSYEEQNEGLTDIDVGHEVSLLGSELNEVIGVPKVFQTYTFSSFCRKPLPIDASKNKILDIININSVVIIRGKTGCGKTTQVPQYILDQCKHNNSACNIIVTQPRRIAAINIAQRVCEERGWGIGTVCGYQVGLDRNVGDDVVLTYVTTEVLLQKLISQKNLNKFTHIVIDEVHERDKTLDFLLLIVRKYLFTNSPTVKIILMSATIETDEFARYFQNIPQKNSSNPVLAPVLHITKETEYKTQLFYNDQISLMDKNLKYDIQEPYVLPQQYETCAKLIQRFDGLDGHDASTQARIIGSVLVFLPGFHEIEEMQKILQSMKSDTQLEVIPLHSSLTGEFMFKAFQLPKPGIRKVILSTNIAESSVTVPDVTYVIDFCFTKVMKVNPVTKFSTLCLEWASKNNCIQRAGRVGRVANGRVYRLVPHLFYKSQMKEKNVPELQRAPLENIILYMKMLDLNDAPKNILSLAISPPNLKDIETCVLHLKEVGALLMTCKGHPSTVDGDITFLGRVMASLPIDIHLAKMIVLGHMFSCLEETIIMAAGCMTRNLFVNNFHDRAQCYYKKLIYDNSAHSDFMTLLTLHEVWIQKKRENSFKSDNDQYVWCRKYYVNLKGMREWEKLIKEIRSRLRNFQIEENLSVAKVTYDRIDRATVLKVIICGAFYPNFFIRTCDYGQVNSLDAAKIVNGRDPFKTVYFTNMQPNQPGRIYVRQIKQLLDLKNNAHVSFDGQSCKIFVEFLNSGDPEAVTIGGVQQLVNVAGTIPAEVYLAVRKRQLRQQFTLDILPEEKAWEFANQMDEKKRTVQSQENEVNCYTSIDYSPLPALDIQYISLVVQHVNHASDFYCQNQDEFTNEMDCKIFNALNGPGVILESVSGEVDDTKMYAAIYSENGKYYRCKIQSFRPGEPPIVTVMFIDYGNTQLVKVEDLCYLPRNSDVCGILPLAIHCQLSEIQPNPRVCPKGVWTPAVNSKFTQRTRNRLVMAKVYSVVLDVVRVQLYFKGETVSINESLINDGVAEFCSESWASKRDHEKRTLVQSSDNRLEALNYESESKLERYTDFESPIFSGSTNVETINLRGPFSALEMQVCGVVEACRDVQVHIEDDSVNTVLLDENPDDPHGRLIVAGHVAQSASSNRLRISQTTVMPNIPGFPAMMTLLFCPKMEPKVTDDGTRVASILCGLGAKSDTSQTAIFPMHDISLILDTELTADLLDLINQLRLAMNQAVRVMEGVWLGEYRAEELLAPQREAKTLLFKLLHARQVSAERVHVRDANVWNAHFSADLEVLLMNIRKILPAHAKAFIWPMLWFVKLNNDNREQIEMKKNLNDLLSIAKGLTEPKEIVCELCKSEKLRTLVDVRMHLFRDTHRSKADRLREF